MSSRTRRVYVLSLSGQRTSTASLCQKLAPRQSSGRLGQASSRSHCCYRPALCLWRLSDWLHPYVKIGKDHTFCSHPVQVRREIAFGTKWTNIGIAHIITENNDEVRPFYCPFSTRTCTAGQSQTDKADTECFTELTTAPKLFRHSSSSLSTFFPISPPPIINARERMLLLKN